MDLDSSPYTQLADQQQSRNVLSVQANSRRPKNGHSARKYESDTEKYFSDVGGYTPQKKQRAVKKRVDVQSSIRESVTPAGDIWAINLASASAFQDILLNSRKGSISPEVLKVDASYTEVLFCHTFEAHLCFIFKFGCVVCWDLPHNQRNALIATLKPYMKSLETQSLEEDDMEYLWSDYAGIKQDIVHLVSKDAFERLAYSYAFAQSVKLAYFETLVDQTIEKTKSLPAGLAKTGKINSKREDISKRVGELFVQRFYINLHTDILDTPDIFWEFDEFSDHYSSCRSYLEIPKRVDILNQRLDIIKDMYDMLNNELTIQHGYKLEWIVIYLICVEVVIEVLWNIIIRDILKLV